MMAIEEIRAQFPALARTVYGKPLVYLDNAATSMRPRIILERQNELASLHNANIHRAVHALAGEATEAYEAARDAVARHLNAASRREIVFTSGTTASINLVAFSFGETFVKPGDEILVSEAEHHSNIVPWQMMCQRKGAVLKVLPVDEEGHLRTDLLPNLLSEKTKLVAISQISNVLGIINPVKDIVSVCHSNGSKVLIDGAQGVVHGGVDVQDLDCDFYAFSGHKVYAATGTGVLYGKEALLEQMVPYMGGGEMIRFVLRARPMLRCQPNSRREPRISMHSPPCRRPWILRPAYRTRPIPNRCETLFWRPWRPIPGSNCSVFPVEQKTK